MLSIGSLVEDVCGGLGLPEVVGDLAGMGVDALTGNWGGVASNVPDLLENVLAERAPGDLVPGLGGKGSHGWLLLQMAAGRLWV